MNAHKKKKRNLDGRITLDTKRNTPGKDRWYYSSLTVTIFRPL